MPDQLPPDVRDRAARAGHRAMNKWEPYPTDATRVLAMVDAVAEVLAAEQSDITPTWEELLPSIRGALPTIDEYDADVARNVALSVEMHLEWRARKADREVLALQARVDLLTTALTEIVAYWDDENAWAEEGDEIRIRVRAALSATPTEPVPLKASQIPTEPGVPSKRVSPGSRSYWAAIRDAEATPTESEAP